MQISNRLKMVADCVTKGYSLADIGTDHGYVPIYLIKNGNVGHVIAMDVRKGPLKKAKENVEKEHLQGQIELRLSDGLDKLKEGETDAILIAGMGGALIVRILDANLKKAKAAKELILSPHSQVELVREYLRTQRFDIKDETMLKDDGKFYTILKVIPQDQCLAGSSLVEYTEEEMQFGKKLIEKQQPEFLEYLDKEEATCRLILEKLKTAPKQTTEKRMQQIEEKLMWIEKCRK